MPSAILSLCKDGHKMQNSSQIPSGTSMTPFSDETYHLEYRPGSADEAQQQNYQSQPQESLGSVNHECLMESARADSRSRKHSDTQARSFSMESSPVSELSADGLLRRIKTVENAARE